MTVLDCGIEDLLEVVDVAPKTQLAITSPHTA